MNDETTTKLEIPDKTQSDSNILRVNFQRTPPPMNPDERRIAEEKTTEIPIPFSRAKVERQIERSGLIPSLEEVNLGSPWVIRLLAVLFILVLSMLML